MKKKSLVESLNQAAGKNDVPLKDKISDRTVKVSSSKSYIPESRVGKKAITGFFEPEVSKELKYLAIDLDTSNQDLLREALNDLFVKHGRKPIA